MIANQSDSETTQILPVNGIQAFVGQAGIKQTEHDDVTLVLLNEHNSIAAVFTQNHFCAAPVRLAQRHLQGGLGIRALVINTGNANAGTGQQGFIDAEAVCAAVARQINCQPEQVLPFSTGVILEPLPVQKIIQTLPTVKPVSLSQAAVAIMTTDTVPKIASRTIDIDGQKIVFTGMAKGSGMIHPNMATMLGFIFTDAPIAQSLLQQMITEIAQSSFNAITVDGDTSTNDSFVVVATGQAQIKHLIHDTDPHYQDIKTALTDLALTLAQAIVRDGEGASKFITIHVKHASTEDMARQVGFAIAHSPLVKTAFYASDANLGRIVCAVGNAGIHDMDINKINIYLDNILVVEHGARAKNYTEEAGQRIMAEPEIRITVDLAQGEAETKIYTCDLSKEYVAINADYRS